MKNKLPKETNKHATTNKRKPPSAKLNLRAENDLTIELGGDWERIRYAADNQSVAHGVTSLLAILGSPGHQIDAEATDFTLGFVDAMQPKDAAELLLLTQMAVTHQAVMMLARHLNQVKTIPQKDCAEKALNKTARTFSAQMETLKRYRSKGKQVVRVERVTVQEGGQAIVGAVEHKGAGR